MKLKMICGCAPLSADSSPIIEIDKIVQDYAWKEFRNLSPCLSGVFIRRSDYIIDVQWNFFEFDHTTTRFNPRPSTKDGFTEKKKVELYSTDFKNDTGMDQTYKFKIQRQTKATTTVTYQRGFTIKGNAKFTLKVPPVFGDCGVSAGLDGQFSITRSQGESFEENFNWETDSEVTVEKNHETTVKMVITEDELEADYEVKTLIKMPSGEAPVFIRRRRDNEVQAVCLISNLKNVFHTQAEDGLVEVITSKFSQNDIRYDIRVGTAGVMRSIRWRDQKILLVSRSLKKDTAIAKLPSKIQPADEFTELSAAELCAHVIRHVKDSSKAEGLEADDSASKSSLKKIQMGTDSGLNSTGPKSQIGTDRDILNPAIHKAQKATDRDIPTSSIHKTQIGTDRDISTPPIHKTQIGTDRDIPTSSIHKSPMGEAREVSKPSLQLTQFQSNPEHRLIKQPTIPTIITEVPSDSEERTVLSPGDSQTFPRKVRMTDEKPRLERGKQCEDAGSPTSDLPPMASLSALQTRRSKLAKITSV